MRTTTPLVTLAVVTLMIVLWPSGSSARYAQDALAPNAEFARQWREVRAKYPLVAVAYLQSVEALSQEIAQQAPERRAAMESAVRLGVTTATQGMTIKALYRLSWHSHRLPQALSAVVVHMTMGRAGEPRV